jgi:hypothetical protein
MKIVKEMVQKLMVSDIKGLDPIAIYLEDQGPGCGKITITCYGQSWTSYWGAITCYGQSWTSYWGAMGEGHTIATFISSCNNQYLANKLSDVKSMVNDPDKLLEDMKKIILTKRKELELNEKDARDYYDEVEFSDAESIMANHDLLYKVYGDEWWCCLPKSPNPEYEYLDRIITAVKEALKG